MTIVRKHFAIECGRLLYRNAFGIAIAWGYVKPEPYGLRYRRLVEFWWPLASWAPRITLTFR